MTTDIILRSVLNMNKDIETASGIQLDIIGKRAGVARPGTDDEYRTTIKLKMNEFKILMSRSNPGGRKLEELIQDILDDIQIKTKVLADGDPSINIIKIIANNTVIASVLETAIWVQERTMNLLHDKYGPDRGPGDPRV